MVDVLELCVLWIVLCWSISGAATFNYGAPWFTQAIAMDFMIRDMFLGVFAPYFAYLEQEETEICWELFWLVFPVSVMISGCFVIYYSY